MKEVRRDRKTEGERKVDSERNNVRSSEKRD